MRILLSVQELMDLLLWEEVCRLKGWNPQGISLGLLDPSEEIKLTQEEALFLGILKEKS